MTKDLQAGTVLEETTIAGFPATVVVDAGRLVAQVGALKWSLINVTEPFRASARPCTVTLSCIVMVVRARMFPAKVESLPRFAELPTCQ